jgi:hypothetical protein
MELPRSARHSDLAETTDRRSRAILKTFGRPGGSVRDRPQRADRKPCEGHPLFPEDQRRYVVGSIRYVKQALISNGEG